MAGENDAHMEVTAMGAWMQSLRVVFWLKIRHMKTALRRMAFAFGTDIEEDEALAERLYQLYAVGMLIVCLLLLWIAALDIVMDAFAAIGPSFSETVFQVSFLAPVCVLGFTGYEYVRSCPIRMQSPDIAYVASSRLEPSAILLGALAGRLLGSTVASLFIFYLVGAGLAVGMPMAFPFDPLSYSVIISLYIAAAVLGAWILGMRRFTREKGARFFDSLVSVAVLVVVFAGSIGGFAAVLILDVPVGSLLFASPMLSVALPLALTVCELAVLLTLARRIVMARVIDENGMFAEMFPLRHMMFNDSERYAEIKRRKKLASKGPVAFFPIGSGLATFITRDMLSIVRQYDGIPTLLMWGAFAAPVAVLLMSGTVNPFFWVIMAQVLIAYPKGVWETTRIYRSDMTNRMLRHHLPYNPFSLLVRDALPSFAFVTFVSIAVILVSIPATPSSEIDPVWGVVLCILLNAVFTLCGGLRHVRFFTTEWHVGYELSVLLSMAAIVAVSLFDTGLILVGTASLTVVVLAYLLKSGSELD